MSEIDVPEPDAPPPQAGGTTIHPPTGGEPAGPPSAAQEGPPAGTRARLRAFEFLEKRGADARWLAVAAIVLAALAIVLFALNHPGIGGILGLLSLAASFLALTPEAGPGGTAVPFAAGLALLGDLLLGIGLVGNATARGSNASIFLGFIVLTLIALLPYLKAVAPVGVLPPRAGLWTRVERIALLMAGGILGRPGISLLVVAIIGGLDASLRLERLLRLKDPQARFGPGFLHPVLDEEGALIPAIRWGSFGVALVVLFLLPQAQSWRF